MRNSPLGLVGGGDPHFQLTEEAEQFVLAAEPALELGQHAEEVGHLAAGAVDQVTLLFQGGELLRGLLGEGPEDPDLVLYLGDPLALLAQGADDPGGLPSALLDGGELGFRAAPGLVEPVEALHGALEGGCQGIDGAELLLERGDPFAEDGGHGGAVAGLGGLQLTRGRLGARDQGFQAAAFTLDRGEYRADLTGSRTGLLTVEALEERHGGSFGVTPAAAAD